VKLDAPAVALRVDECVVKLCADVACKFGAGQDSAGRFGDIDGAEAVVENVIDSCFNPLRFEFEAEGFAQHKNRGEN